MASAPQAIAGLNDTTPTSHIATTYLRRSRVFPPVAKGTPRNPKYALHVTGGVDVRLAAKGPHSCAPQIHNVWDRSACGRCLSLAQLLAAGLTPEVDPCAGYYAALKTQRDGAARREAAAEADGSDDVGGADSDDGHVASNGGDDAHCARNICAGGSGGSVGESVLKVHHYVLPSKSYRRAGAGDAGAKRDMWNDDVLDTDALRFTAA
jgi:hypothetical protein